MRLLQRLWRDRSGVSAVEFALILPFLAALIVGTIEFGRLIMVTQKLQNGSFILADLTARAKDTELTETALASIFGALDSTMKPFAMGSNGIAMISSVSELSTGKTRINWQRSGGGKLSVLSAIGKQGDAAVLPKTLTMVTGETLIVAEVFYDYVPVFGTFVAAQTLHKIAYYKPRLGALETLAP